MNIGDRVSVRYGTYIGKTGRITRLLPNREYPVEIAFDPPVVGTKCYAGFELELVKVRVA